VHQYYDTHSKRLRNVEFEATLGTRGFVDFLGSAPNAARRADSESGRALGRNGDGIGDSLRPIILQQ
jgi:hypothetical protein